MARLGAHLVGKEAALGMVARNTDAETRQNHPSDGVILRFLLWWQRTLTAVLGRSMDVAKRTSASADVPVGGVREPLAPQSAALAWAGGLATVIGAAGTVALPIAGTTRSVAIFAAVMMLVWAGVRWVLMDIVARRRSALTRVDIRGAWAVGSLVWVLGVTPELRVLAWVASGAATWLILERLGATRRQALECVGIAWGAQALVVVGSWLARNAIIAILASRG